MEANWRVRDVRDDNPNVPQGNDYEYDEAHDRPPGPVAAASATRPVNPPEVNVGDDGDYGYDEAHDFGTDESSEVTDTRRSLSCPRDDCG